MYIGVTFCLEHLPKHFLKFAAIAADEQLSVGLRDLDWVYASGFRV